jgi:cell division protein FtsB
MAAFHWTRQDRRLKLVLVVMLLVLLLLQARLWSGPGSLADINRLDGDIRIQESDNAVLTQRNEGLRQEVDDLKNGLDSIEERARSQLGLVRKGETFILIVDGEESAAGLPARPETWVPPAASVSAAAGIAAEPESVVDTLPPPLAADEEPPATVTIDPVP